jgi:hypothetical protein
VIEAMARRLALAVVLPVLLSLVAHYGFVSGYTSGVFDRAGFVAQYRSAVYQYRPLGRDLVLAVDQWLRARPERIERVPRSLRRVPEPLSRAVSGPAEVSFYIALFAVNTSFFVLGALLLYQLAMAHRGPDRGPDRPDRGPDREPRLQLALFVLLLSLWTLSLFVVVPYDNLSYFLLLLGIQVAVARASGSEVSRRPLVVGAGLVGLVALATAVRESALVLAAFYAALRFEGLRQRRREPVLTLSAMLAVFALVYFLPRRVALAGVERPELWANLSGLLPLAGIALLIIISSVLISLAEDRRRSLVFVAACAPYLAAVLMVGAAWEIRLWVPVWLGLGTLAVTPRESATLVTP